MIVNDCILDDNISLHCVLGVCVCNPLLPGVRITVSVPDTTYKIDLTSVVVRLS